MFTKRRNRALVRRRRSGISSLIGAIFFVLVVFLVFSSTILIFENFTNYALSFKQVNSEDLSNKASDLSFQSVAFGGNVTTLAAPETLTPVANTVSSSLKPIQNMNLTGSMDGWALSRIYELSLHNGTITNYPENVLPGLELYTLTVTNNDSAGLPSYISGVQLSVSPSFTVPSCVQQAPAGWSLVTPVCGPVNTNSITWTTACASGIANGDSETFMWAAVAPPVVGSFFHTVTLTWQKGVCPPQKDTGLTPLATNVVTAAPGNTIKAVIHSVPSGTVPGGAFGGYDGMSAIGSDSGPGSLYITYGPSLNGKPLTSGQQLTTQLNYTTDFTTTAPITPSTACCELSVGYDMDKLITNSSQLLLNAYLTDLNTGSVKDVINNTIVNELNGQNVSSTGWVMNDVHFSLTTTGVHALAPGSILPAGTYELTLSLSATLFGAKAPSSDYPGTLLLHFDDIGLALQESVTSYCADSASSSPSGPCAPTTSACNALPTACSLIVSTGTMNPQQVQSLKVSAYLSESAPSGLATAYAYVEDIGASSKSPSWVEIGQVSFTSSATLSATIPGSSAPQYLDSVGDSCWVNEGTGVVQVSDPAGSYCFRVYVIQPTASPIRINMTASEQTWQGDQGIVYIKNNGTSPIHIISLDVSGPSASYHSSSSFSSWVSPGQTAPLAIGTQPSTVLPGFVWATGQTYVITIVTDKGLSISETFVSP